MPRQATCLALSRQGCRAPPAELAQQGSRAEEEAEAGDPATQRTNYLRTAVQRDAAPGRIADFYIFGRTLGVGGYAVVAYVEGYAVTSKLSGKAPDADLDGRASVASPDGRAASAVMGGTVGGNL